MSENGADVPSREVGIHADLFNVDSIGLALDGSERKLGQDGTQAIFRIIVRRLICAFKNCVHAIVDRGKSQDCSEPPFLACWRAQRDGSRVDIHGSKLDGADGNCLEVPSRCALLERKDWVCFKLWRAGQVVGRCRTENKVDCVDKSACRLTETQSVKLRTIDRWLTLTIGLDRCQAL